MKIIVISVETTIKDIGRFKETIMLSPQLKSRKALERKEVSAMATKKKKSKKKG